MNIFFAELPQVFSQVRVRCIKSLLPFSDLLFKNSACCMGKQVIHRILLSYNFYCLNFFYFTFD